MLLKKKKDSEKWPIVAMSSVFHLQSLVYDCWTSREAYIAYLCVSVGTSEQLCIPCLAYVYVFVWCFVLVFMALVFELGNGHIRTTEQGLNVQLDEGIEDRDVFSPLKSSEARFTTIILPTSTEMPQPPSPSGKSCSDTEKDPGKWSFWNNSSQINNADRGLLPSHVYCIVIGHWKRL